MLVDVITTYRNLVGRLIATAPLDQAMAAAVGGGPFDDIGRIELAILEACGLSQDHSLYEIGCGSGRLAKALGRRFAVVDYVGIDVVPELLDYARNLTPASFRFFLNETLTIPAPDASADMIAAFSVFTHLLHEHTYAYLLDSKRALRPGGKIVFSFLEMERHWHIFEPMIGGKYLELGQPLNMFIERPTIEMWASKLELAIDGFDPGPPLGQSVVALRNRI